MFPAIPSQISQPLISYCYETVGVHSNRALRGAQYQNDYDEWLLKTKNQIDAKPVILPSPVRYLLFTQVRPDLNKLSTKRPDDENEFPV